MRSGRSRDAVETRKPVCIIDVLKRVGDPESPELTALNLIEVPAAQPQAGAGASASVLRYSTYFISGYWMVFTSQEDARASTRMSEDSMNMMPKVHISIHKDDLYRGLAAILPIIFNHRVYKFKCLTGPDKTDSSNTEGKGFVMYQEHMTSEKQRAIVTEVVVALRAAGIRPGPPSQDDAEFPDGGGYAWWRMERNCLGLYVAADHTSRHRCTQNEAALLQAAHVAGEDRDLPVPKALVFDAACLYDFALPTGDALKEHRGEPNELPMRYVMQMAIFTGLLMGYDQSPNCEHLPEGADWHRTAQLVEAFRKGLWDVPSAHSLFRILAPYFWCADLVAQSTPVTRMDPGKPGSLFPFLPAMYHYVFKPMVKHIQTGSEPVKAMLQRLADNIATGKHPIHPVRLTIQLLVDAWRTPQTSAGEQASFGHAITTVTSEQIKLSILDGIEQAKKRWAPTLNFLGSVESGQLEAWVDEALGAGNVAANEAPTRRESRGADEPAAHDIEEKKTSIRRQEQAALDAPASVPVPSPQAQAQDKATLAYPATHDAQTTRPHPMPTPPSAWPRNIAVILGVGGIACLANATFLSLAAATMWSLFGAGIALCLGALVLGGFYIKHMRDYNGGLTAGMGQLGSQAALTTSRLGPSAVNFAMAAGYPVAATSNALPRQYLSNM